MLHLISLEPGRNPTPAIRAGRRRRGLASLGAFAVLSWLTPTVSRAEGEAVIRLTKIAARPLGETFRAHYPLRVSLSLSRVAKGPLSPTLVVGLIETSSLVQRFWRSISGDILKLRTCELGAFRLDLPESAPADTTVTKDFVVPAECLPKEDKDERFNFWVAIDPAYADNEDGSPPAARPKGAADTSLKRVNFFTRDSGRFEGLESIGGCEIAGTDGCSLVLMPFEGGSWSLLGNKMRFPMVAPPALQQITLRDPICHETLGAPDFSIASQVTIHGLPPREPIRPSLPPTNIANLMAEESVLRYAICPAATETAGDAACAAGSDYASLKIRNWIGPVVKIPSPARVKDGVTIPASVVTKNVPALLDEMSPRVWNLGAPLDVTNDLYIAPETEACTKLSGPWRSHRVFNLRTCWSLKEPDETNPPSCRVVKVGLDFPPPSGAPRPTAAPMEPGQFAKSGYEDEWRKSYMGGYNLGVDMSVGASQHVDLLAGAFSRASAVVDLIGEQLAGPVRVGTLQFIAMAPLPGGGATNTIDVYFLKPNGESTLVDRVAGPGAITARKTKIEIPVETEIPLNGYLRASNAELPVAIKVTGSIKVSIDAAVDVREKKILQSLPVDKVGFTAKTAAVTDPSMLGSLRYALDADFELAAYLVFSPRAPDWLLDAQLKEIPQKEGEVKIVERAEHILRDREAPVLRVRVASNLVHLESSTDWALGQRDRKPAMRVKWARSGEATVTTRRAAVHLVATPRQLAMCGEHAAVKFFFDCPQPVRFVQALFQGEGISHEREPLFPRTPSSFEEIIQ